ncbi:DUF3861 domain-containing protein [Mucilaginibacter agri]|uniref:DUF3861 family protein n=1 Tax=Mucilaginibacter agri TaxID=2695265 RepID=A0A965ZFX2_9SPHI|nr:DUF3861 domain-containing protein [Mucilaginibacter agri]NCD70200.1 DUF3861 family protein [Mucilaginibacter agri]
MATRANKYNLVLTQISYANGDPGDKTPIDISFENHDEIFGIIERIQQKDPFNDPAAAAEFALGLKLFSEVMLKNRDNPLFSDLLPAFKPFMQKLKTL